MSHRAGQVFVQRRDPDRDRLTGDAESHLRQLVDLKGFGVESVYYGCATQERADDWRRAFKRAGKRLGVAVWAVWHHCGDGPFCADGHRYCELAGDTDCTWHVHFRAHQMDDAQRYMAAKAKAFGWPQRTRQQP